MPQMSPMWWLTLLMIFNTLTMISISMMYFNSTTKTKLKNMNYKINMIWKW
uniref:ATP synthase F0 subunit 8 n=1 Tax=Gargara minuta TaxID=3021816 RepID=UPI00237A9A51|nr:ATP synthase F0 subunit 8 [Gargara minuta]WBV77331.1 ATP synthase F0 subunit 8 [Gargara minuta]